MNSLCDCKHLRRDRIGASLCSNRLKGLKGRVWLTGFWSTTSYQAFIERSETIIVANHRACHWPS